MTSDALLEGYAAAYKAAKELYDARAGLCLDDQGVSPKEVSAEGSMDALEDWALKRPFLRIADALPMAAILSTRRNNQMFDKLDMRLRDDAEERLMMWLLNGLMTLAKGEAALAA